MLDPLLSQSERHQDGMNLAVEPALPSSNLEKQVAAEAAISTQAELSVIDDAAEAATRRVNQRVHDLGLQIYEPHSERIMHHQKDTRW